MASKIGVDLYSGQYGTTIRSKANREFLALSPCFKIKYELTNNDLDLGVSFKMLFGSVNIVILQNTNKVY